MGDITLGEICDAVKDTLEEATGMTCGQSYDELSAGVNADDLPMLRVYWYDLVMNSTGGTDRLTFQGVISHKEITIYADVYAAQRSHLDEDVKAAVDTASAFLDVLEAQDTGPLFGHEGIKAFRANGTFALFDWGQTLYLGSRWVLTIHVY